MAAVPADMTSELRVRLGKRDFCVEHVDWSDGLYEALVRVEPRPGGDVPSRAPSLLPLERSSVFQAKQSRCWPLRCCWDTLKLNVPIWLACFYSSKERVTLGETELGLRLFDEIKEAAQGSGQTECSPPTGDKECEMTGTANSAECTPPPP